MKHVGKIFLGSVLISLLASCDTPQDQSLPRSDNTPLSPKTHSSSATTQSESTPTHTALSDVSDTEEKVLTIDPKCIGCGHCIRFASGNFKMNFQTHKAEVISQEIINSNGVQRAIERCPVDAISLG